MPDYLLLSVDDSGSMHLDDIWKDQADYEDFVNSIKDIPGCSNIIVAPADRRDFPNIDVPDWERWVDEMRLQILNVIYGL